MLVMKTGTGKALLNAKSTTWQALYKSSANLAA
jgi:hypothetical protein